MSKTVGIEFYCRDCDYTERSKTEKTKCKKCGSKDVCNTAYVICRCGTSIYLEKHINECPICGKLYDRYGLKIKPKES